MTKVHNSGLLTGYFYKGAPAAVAVEYLTWDTCNRPLATIYGYVESGDIDDLQKREFSSIVGAYQWLSQTLDGKPKVFGKINLSDREKLLSVHGDGAEYFVMSYLMLTYGIFASKTNRCMPGFDLLASLPTGTGRSCRIQVKYRKSPGRPLPTTNIDFDFLVLITPGRDEYISGHSLDGSIETSRTVKNWVAYVVPVSVVRSKRVAAKSMKMDYTNYRMSWELISDFLAEPLQPVRPAPTLARGATWKPALKTVAQRGKAAKGHTVVPK